jgi:two-component system, NarL family, sensor kinase
MQQLTCKIFYCTILCYDLVKWRYIVIGGIILFLFLHVNLCQSKNLDSLENVLNTKKLTTNEKLDLYNDLSWDYLNIDVSKSKFLSLQGIELSIKTKKDKMSGILYHHLGIACYNEGQLDSALFYFHIAESFSQKVQDNNRLNLIGIAYAVVYDTQGEYQKAISILMKLLPKLEKAKRDDLVRTVYGNLGTLYQNVHNYNLSEKYYLLSEKESLKTNDDWRLSQACNGLMNICIIKKEYKKALEYADKALAVANRCGDNECRALTYQKMSEVYYIHYRDVDKARRFALKGLQIARENCAPNDIAAMLINISNIFYQQKNYRNSMKYALEAARVDTIDQSVYENTVANIVKSGIFLGEKQLAIQYFEKYYNIVEARSKKELQMFEMDSEKKYQTEKKELQIVVLQKHKKLITTIFVSFSIVLLLLLLIIYFRLIITKRNKQIAEHRIIQLEQEKQLVATQSILEGENAERTRLARDLHDGLGGMLSAIKINLFDMKHSVTLETDDVSRLNKVFGMLDESMQELRRVAYNMMPESLSRYGLKVSLSDFCNNFSNVHFHYFGNERRFDTKTEIMLYRIAHELVNNAIKHSKAKSINVQVVQEADRISLTVYDDGCGFDKTTITEGNGLRNITDRVYSLGGNIDITSENGKGTEITVNIKV